MSINKQVDNQLVQNSILFRSEKLTPNAHTNLESQHFNWGKGSVFLYYWLVGLLVCPDRRRDRLTHHRASCVARHIPPPYRVMQWQGGHLYTQRWLTLELPILPSWKRKRGKNLSFWVWASLLLGWRGNHLTVNSWQQGRGAIDVYRIFPYL